MTHPTSNQQVVLARRPAGAPRVDDFAVIESALPPLQDGEVLIENLFISLDAGFRKWMDEGSGDHILPAMEIGQPVMGLTLGRVVDSRHPDFAAGQHLMARLAWERYSVTDATDFLVVVPDQYDCPLNWHLGILGDTGMSAYFGLTDVARPQPGETAVISAAGGAVGSIAGQIARIYGARAVGIASGPDKCRRLIEELGYDAAVDRNGEDVVGALAEACPDGIDVYLDSVSGPLLELVLGQINPRARIALCGAVATYNAGAPLPGPSNLFQLVTNQATMTGFMTHLMHERYPEARQQLLDWIEEGKLVNREHMLHGIESVPTAFCDLFAGRNFGKTIVALS
ncbi:MAG: NADP-dependent oxidoreductase [Gammaproteobacteria bacterium]|nr:NADP-dependent oxidoreductase [Gammaproteobacteria bacterium]